MFILSSLNAHSLHKTSIQLMWLDQFEFAGFYVAKEKGFYAELDLDVEIKKYNKSINVLNEVMEKRADFGTNSTSLIIEKSNGKDIYLLGSIFQSSPLILLALKNSKINNLKDIKNKKLMITEEQKDFASLQSMLINQNISLNNLYSMKHSFDVNDLINKKTDFMLAYTTNEPYILKEKGYESKIFHPKDYGFDFYEELLFTTKEFAQNNPKIVKDFYTATIKGWQYAFDNIEEVAKLIHKNYNPQNKSLESLIFEANEMKKLVYDQNNKIGTITKEKINLIINTYQTMGLLKNPINVDDLIYTKHLPSNFFLNSEEKKFLEQKKEITVCIDPDWMPFEKIENNKHIGISADYIRLIEEKIQIPIKLIPTKNWSESLEFSKQKFCDILPLIMKTANREAFLDFTTPYIKLPLAIAGNINSSFIENLYEIKDKKIGLAKDYAYNEILKNKFPHLEFVDVKNIKDGLKKVEDGQIFAYIGNLSSLGYHIQKDYIGQLKIIGKFDETINLSMGTRNDQPLLNSIFEKSLDTITNNQKQEISDKWIHVNYQKEVKYVFSNELFIGLLILIILSVLIYRQYLLKKINIELNEKIEIEIQKNEEKNRISIQQSRMASMGEMLENIAHQWRQPLSTISVAATGMKLKKELGILNDEDVNDSLNHITNATQYLSNTIEDFRTFFSKDKISSNINIRNTINKAFDLVSSTFAKSEITVIRDIKDITFSSYENELIQVLMNILMNAKDALENKENEKLLIIKVREVKDNLVITLKDNAGGIKDDIIDKIFEPYFTTKHQYNGTGIGLYMSKLIVEKHLDGEIHAMNDEFKFNNKTYTGALFKIILPLYKD